ncbi:porin [Dyella sp. ASV21]|uniref:porin n=1 Tax=Dyella sp. ASV21 TaxID=2795114 RepID=UPI0018EDF99B|nr:porin [Dyella sp. ASV21]
MNRPIRCLLRQGLAATLLWLGHAAGAQAADTGDNSWQPTPYTLGQGLYFPGQGLRIGGYADFNFYNVQGTNTKYNVRELSLFITKDLGTRWQLFAEIEASNPVNTSSHGDDDDSELDIERLYADYHANQAITFRLGKFLTPVGEWNLVHADPLTWTVSRPLSTSAAFARHATGAMMFGTLPMQGNDLDYWVFADDSKNLNIGHDEDNAFTNYGTNQALHNNFRQAFGGRVLYHLLGDSLNIGASAVNYELESPRQKYLLSGIDFSWTSRYLSLTGEGIYRSSTSKNPDERGGFVQAEVPLWQRLYLIERYERYRSSRPAQTTTVHATAINYKPIQGVVLKLEYRDGLHNQALAPTGWLASIAVLF